MLKFTSDGVLCRDCHKATKETKACDWHKDQEPIADGEAPGCCGCGALYHTRMCDACHQEFLDWKAVGWDDVCAGPYATASGDLYCTRCGPAHDRAQEQEDYEG